MYDFRKDLSLIVSNIELTKEGLAAIKAAVNLAEYGLTTTGFGGKHSQPTYQKSKEHLESLVPHVTQSEVVKTESDDIDTFLPELDDKPDKPSLNSNYDELTDESYYEDGEDDTFTSMLLTNVSIDSRNDSKVKADGLKTPQETFGGNDSQLPVLEDKQSENANMKPSGNGMTLAQHNAVQKYKSINERLYNEIRNWINDADKKPDFTALHYTLENHRNSIRTDDLGQTDAYYLMLNQTINYAQKLFSLYEEKTNDQQSEIDSLFKQTDVIIKGFLNYLNGFKQDEFIDTLSEARKEQKPSLLSKATLAIMNNYIEEDIDTTSDNLSNAELEEDKDDIINEFFNEDETKANTINKLVDDDEKESQTFDLKPKEYVVNRRLNGAQLMDKDGKQAFYVTETQVHALNLQTGDIVKADGQPYQQDNNGFKLKKVMGHLDGVTDNPPIIEFKQAVVEDIDGNLVVRHNISGKPLMVNGEQTEYLTDNSKLQSEIYDGSIVDLAWYDLRNMPNPQRAIAVRWIYPTKSESSVLSTQSHGKRNKYKGIKKHNENKKKDTKENSKISQEEARNHFQEMLKFAEKVTGTSSKVNLKGLKVGIAIGGGQNWETIKNAVILLNGKPRLINAFSGKRKTIRKVVKGLDVVVLVQSYANHSSSWQISDACKEYGVKFAISSKLAVQSILQALFRAMDNQPVFLPSGQVIDYAKDGGKTEEK